MRNLVIAELHSPFTQVCLYISLVWNLAISEARLRTFSTILHCWDYDIPGNFWETELEMSFSPIDQKEFFPYRKSKFNMYTYLPEYVSKWILGLANVSSLGHPSSGLWRVCRLRETEQSGIFSLRPLAFGLTMNSSTERLLLDDLCILVTW